MFVYNRFLGSLINKLTWFVLIAIIGLICFFGGLWVANAETCSTFLKTSNGSSFAFKQPLSGTDDIYSHDKVRDVLPTLFNSNSTFTTSYGTFTLYEFYQKFNYAVVQQNEVNYFRVYYQDFEMLKSLNCGNLTNKFYLYAVYTSMKANSGYAYVSYGYMYSFYVDIHIDSTTNDIIIDSISTPNETPLFSTIESRRFGSEPGWSSWTWTFPFIDSYNNFAIPNSMDDTYKQFFFNGVSSFAGQSYARYPNETLMIHSTSTPIDGIVSYYTGDEVTEDTPEVDPENPGGADYSGILNEIKDELDYSNSVLDNIQDIVDGIGSGLTNFREEVAGGFNDVVNSIGDGIDSIIDWFSETFDSESSFEDWIQDFSHEDNGGISQIITSPLRLIYSLDDNSDCEPLRFSIWNKEVAIPNGCIIWSLASNEVVTTYHVVIYGYLTYRILIELFILIEKLKDPKEREVSTLDL